MSTNDATPTPDYSDRRGGVFVVQDGKRVRLEPDKPKAPAPKRARKSADAVTPTESTTDDAEQ